MTSPHDPASIKLLIASILSRTLGARGMSTTDLQDDLDLRAQGLVDSLGFMQLIAALEARLERPIDLAELDPDHLTKVGSLAQHIAWRQSAS